MGAAVSGSLLLVAYTIALELQWYTAGEGVSFFRPSHTLASHPGLQIGRSDLRLTLVADSTPLFIHAESLLLDTFGSGDGSGGSGEGEGALRLLEMSSES